MRRSPVSPGKFRAMPLVLLVLGVTLAAQLADLGQPREVDERIRALQRESERLASEADSLVGELRRLEMARDRRIRDARDAEAAADAARQAVDASFERREALERQRLAQLPDLEAQLVDLYKRGRSRHARLLVGAGSVREFARARRAVAALITISERRLADHQRLLEALRDEHAALEQAAEALEAQETEARLVRAAAERAVSAHVALVRRIETQQAVNTQYVAELEAAYRRLQEELTALPAAGEPPPRAGAPLVRRQLRWPAAGPVTGQFGQTAGRLGGSAVRNGIELAAPEGTPVLAAHAGIVSYAGPYTGFGTLVVLSHGGSDYSLYGYLGAVSVQAGDQLEAGSELGRVGFAPAGPPALYFELRVDGQPVDPVQWLEPR
jgi:murein hydrolase activator